MKKSKGDRLLELSLYVLGWCLFFVYFFVDIKDWQEQSFFYIFCGFFLYVSLLQLLMKKHKKKIDYLIPPFILGASIPAGWGFDYVVNSLLTILLGDMGVQLELILMVITLCSLVCVISAGFLMISLIFWEEIF